MRKGEDHDLTAEKEMMFRAEKKEWLAGAEKEAIIRAENKGGITANLCPGRQTLFDIFLHAYMPDAGAISSVIS